MTEDFYKAMNIITSQKQFSNDYNKYDRVYPYTTENITGYLESIKDKSILTVVGSGDHYLNLITMGARNVDAFDINIFAIYYLRLKKAAIRALTRREFFEFMTNDSLRYFDKVKKYLDMASYDFWNNYIKYFTFNNGIQGSFLFYPRDGGDDYLRRNIYLTEEGYEQLRENINGKWERHYQGDIYEVANKLYSRYDTIYLSNINSYQHDMEKYRDLILRLRDINLTDSGEIFYGYFYRSLGMGLDFYKEAIPETEDIEVDSVYEGEKDIVYKLKNKRD